MIAVPITGKNIKQALAGIKKANSSAGIIELRLDFFPEINETILAELLRACKKPAIVTFRQQNFGASAEAIERMFLLQKAMGFGAAYVDLDFETDRDFLSMLAGQKGKTKIILSCHNFDETPPLQALLALLQKMLSFRQADILKIVTFARSNKDNETILEFLKAAKRHGKPIIAFCMGAKGKKSRVQCLKEGSLLSFAALEKGKESAPGQLTVEEMEKALEND